MRILLKTYVEQPPEEVFEGFDQNLFLKLKPPGVSLKLLRFDGSQKGDIVKMQLNFGLFKQEWTSTITDSGKSEEEIFFVDEAEGKALPFFLKEWKHQHRLLRQGAGTLIVDDIYYKAPLGMNLLLYPALWMQFAYRKPIYRREFKQSEPQRQ